MCYGCVIVCVLEQSVFNADKENANHPIQSEREREREPMTEIAKVQVHKLATF